MVLRPIAAEHTWQLRHQILRPNQTLADCAYPLDMHPASFHAGCFVEGVLVGVGSVFDEAPDGSSGKHSWRIRGMAVAESTRGAGAGGLILRTLISHAASQGLPGEIWCNGRATVKGFYEHFGFVQVGEVFDLPPIGPHVVMRRDLVEADRLADISRIE